MSDFQECVAKKIPTQWYEFGRNLGFTEGDLDAIESMYARSGCMQCFMQLFSQWEKAKNQNVRPCLWSTVVATLRVLQDTPTCSNAALASEIQSKFLSSSSSIAVPQPPSLSEAVLQNNVSPPPDQHDFMSLPSSMGSGQGQSGDNLSLPTNNSHGSSSGYASMSTTYKLEEGNSPLSSKTASMSYGPAPAGISSPPLYNGGNEYTSLATNMSMGRAHQVPHHLLPQQCYPQQQGHTHSLPQEMTGHKVMPSYGDRPIVMSTSRPLPDDIIEKHPIEEVTETSEEFLSLESTSISDMRDSRIHEVIYCIYMCTEEV